MSKGVKRVEIDQFLNEFGRQKEILSKSLKELGSESPEGIQRPQEQFDQLIKDYNQAKKLFNDISSVLPAYNLKQSQEALNNIWTEIEAKREQLIPRKKFTFKKQDPKVPTKPSGDEVDRSAPVLYIHDGLDIAAVVQERLDENIDLAKDEVDGQDLHFTNLTRCHIKAIGSPNNVYLKGLKDCTVEIGPAKTSIFVNECIRCTFNLCAQQLRIHSTTKCTCFVLTTSKPIIEDCVSLRFDRYQFEYENISNDFEAAAIDPEKGFFNQVIDFNWLSTDKPSPNWSDNKLYTKSCT